jgi:hypothetical protein
MNKQAITSMLTGYTSQNLVLRVNMRMGVDGRGGNEKQGARSKEQITSNQ